MNPYRRLLVPALSAFTALAMLTSAQAQGVVSTPCPYVHIRDDSAKLDVDGSQICAAAKPFFDQGVDTYLYMTDVMFDNRNTWFDHLDQVEMAFKIREPGNSFKDTAFSISISSDSSQPWGANTTLGKLLQQTPLERNGNIERVQTILKGEIAMGDPTGALVHFLNTSYDVAYLQQIHAQETKVSARATDLFLNPPPTPLPPKTFAQIKAESEAQQKMLSSLVNIAFFVLLALLFVYLSRKLAKYTMERWRLHRQAMRVHNRIGDILLKMYALIAGDQGDKLYAFWNSLGGSLQPQDSEVSRHLSEARSAGSEAIALWKVLKEAPFSFSLGTARKFVTDLEKLYLLMVGSVPEIMNLTGVEQWDLMDVTAAVGSDVEGQLAAEIHAILASRDADTLQIAMMFEKPEDHDKNGMLGHILEVKKAIGQLQALREQLPDDHAKLHQLRDEFVAAQAPIHSMVTLEDQSTYIDAQLELAATLIAESRWFEADQALDRAYDALNRAPALLDELHEVFDRFDSRTTAFRRIDASGYDLSIPECDKPRQECEDDVTALVKAIKAGDWSKVEELTTELEADSKRMLEAAKAVVSLHDNNEVELKRLAEEVARVQAYGAEVDRMWTSLHRYPASNFADLDGTLDRATQTLLRLFDNPSDPGDLASQIATLNSMQEQSFKEAEQALLQAFSDLHDAEMLLQAIQARLEQVQTIESNIAQQIVDATLAHEKAFARRELENVLIDGSVDEQIEQALRLIGEATVAAEKRHLTTAAAKIAEAHKLADLAYASADKQASRIKGLRVELEQSRTGAVDTVGQVISQREEVTLAAQTSQTNTLIQNAQKALDAAKKVELAIGGEDHVLEGSLERAIQAYRAATAAGRQAIQSLEADDRSYRQLIAEVGGEIDAAERAITGADRYVRDSDAHSSGSGSLDKARSALPSKPAYGVTMEQLRVARANAKVAIENAAQAESSARSRIRREEQEREEEERRQRRAREAALAASRSSYSSSSSSYSSGSRSSGFSSGFSSRGFSSGSRH